MRIRLLPTGSRHCPGTTTSRASRQEEILAKRSEAISFARKFYLLERFILVEDSSRIRVLAIVSSFVLSYFDILLDRLIGATIYPTNTVTVRSATCPSLALSLSLFIGLNRNAKRCSVIGRFPSKGKNYDWQSASTIPRSFNRLELLQRS